MASNFVLKMESYSEDDSDMEYDDDECNSEERLINEELGSKGRWLGEEDSWSSEDEAPMDSEEEEYLAYGNNDDEDYNAPDDSILMGLDEDYNSSDLDSDELLSEDEVADVSAWEIFVHNCRK